MLHLRLRHARPWSPILQDLGRAEQDPRGVHLRMVRYIAGGEITQIWQNRRSNTSIRAGGERAGHNARTGILYNTAGFERTRGSRGSRWPANVDDLETVDSAGRPREAIAPGKLRTAVPMARWWHRAIEGGDDDEEARRRLRNLVSRRGCWWGALETTCLKKTENGRKDGRRKTENYVYTLRSGGRSMCVFDAAHQARSSLADVLDQQDQEAQQMSRSCVLATTTWRAYSCTSYRTVPRLTPWRAPLIACVSL